MAKRGNGEGSIYQRKSNGRWEGSISLDDGTRKVIYGKTRGEVQEKIKKLLSEQQQGMLPVNSKATVQEYIEKWLEEVHKPLVKLSTYNLYQTIVRIYIVPDLGHIKLQSLTPQHIQSFYSKKLKAGLSPKSINNIHGVLHKALANAVRWNLLARNVCDLVTPPRLVRTEKTVLTIEQARLLLAEVKEHNLEGFLTLALVTGMRVGEIMALHWSDIDLQQGSIQVRRTVNYIKGHGYVESDPKTTKSRRRINLPRFVVNVLLKHQEKQARQRDSNEGWVEQGLVFTNSVGGHMARTTLRETFNRILKKAGLPHVRFHDLRHGAATILLSWGVHPKVVQEILGHSQISMTLDTYSHVLPSMQREVTEKWDDWDEGAGAGVVLPQK